MSTSLLCQKALRGFRLLSCKPWCLEIAVGLPTGTFMTVHWKWFTRTPEGRGGRRKKKQDSCDILQEEEDLDHLVGRVTGGLMHENLRWIDARHHVATCKLSCDGILKSRNTVVPVEAKSKKFEPRRRGTVNNRRNLLSKTPTQCFQKP